MQEDRAARLMPARASSGMARCSFRPAGLQMVMVIPVRSPAPGWQGLTTGDGHAGTLRHLIQLM